MLINRRQALIGSVGAAAGLAIYPAFGEVPPLKKKDSYKVGFAQTESNNPWRLAQTASMKDEAAKRGCQIVYTDAAGSAAKQVAAKGTETLCSDCPLACKHLGQLLSAETRPEAHAAPRQAHPIEIFARA